MTALVSNTPVHTACGRGQLLGEPPAPLQRRQRVGDRPAGDDALADKRVGGLADQVRAVQQPGIGLPLNDRPAQPAGDAGRYAILEDHECSTCSGGAVGMHRGAGRCCQVD